MAEFREKVPPLAAQLPQTSGSVAKKRPTAAAKGAERLWRLWGVNGGRSAPASRPHEFEPKIIFQLPINRPGGRYVTTRVRGVGPEPHQGSIGTTLDESGKLNSSPTDGAEPS